MRKPRETGLVRLLHIYIPTCFPPAGEGGGTEAEEGPEEAGGGFGGHAGRRLKKRAAAARYRYVSFCRRCIKTRGTIAKIDETVSGEQVRGYAIAARLTLKGYGKVEPERKKELSR